MSRILVAGASGLIGGHLVKRLLSDGHEVRAVGRRPVGEWSQRHDGAENLQLDLTEKKNCYSAADGVDLVYNLAADIGGVNFIEKNKALCMLSVLINTHLLMAARDLGVKRYLYTSTFAVAAADHQPANVLEDGHIWEKLFSERLCRHFREDFGLETRVARLQNVYGTHDRIRGERVRAPAALALKALEAKRRGDNRIEIWGDGTQVRSFLFAEDCADGLAALMSSGITDPVRIGSNEFTSVNQLVDAIEAAAGVKLERIYDTSAPRGIERKPDEVMAIDSRLGWQPRVSLQEGIDRLYRWIEGEMAEAVQEV
ncbi:MAG: NAD-dependent epimerase/dehydratase family protein [Candidatus Sungbacteria bacterium]|uniref:NAD-dependent epimerase/dehydratase family protein n=1 Tax=Candidatus Sungiibacteriota bacterium TaxID=2750080 RepID=A0A932YYK4_9BACT|nr:NAD-dependent epimerase/dehydratase family protein [Candidatus Sungbacteria bacterium]